MPAHDTEQFIVELERVIANAIDRVDDPRHRQAAEALLGLTPSRWTPLQDRRARAGVPFNVGWEGFRRPLTEGSSYESDTLYGLARAILSSTDVDVGEEPTERSSSTVSVDASGVSASPTATSPPEAVRHRRRWLVLIVAVALIAGAAGAFTMLTREPDRPEKTAAPSTTSVPSAKCQTDISVPAEAPELRNYVAPFEQVSKGVGRSVGCPIGPLSRWGALVVQPLLDSDGRRGAIAAAEPGRPLVFTYAEWQSYRQIGGKSGEQAQTTGGLPVRRTERPGRVEIELSTGVHLVGERRDGPLFWIPSAAVPTWRQEIEAGRLGLPTSNPVIEAGTVARLDFEEGIVRLSPAGGVEITAVPEPASELPDEIEGRIVRNGDGTAWYVDEKRVRHWIPDGAVWECKGGTENVAGRTIPGYAIATLPLGPPAEC